MAIKRADLMSLADALYVSGIPKAQRARAAIAVADRIRQMDPRFDVARFIIIAVEGPNIQPTPGG